MGFLHWLGTTLLTWLLEKLWGLFAAWLVVKQKVGDAFARNKANRERLEAAETKEERDHAAEEIIRSYNDRMD